MVTMGARDFDALHDLVISDAAAQAQLRAAPEWEAFVAAARQLAAGHGLDVTRSDFEQAREDARRAMIDRGI
jgi:hypothetical protein